MSQKLEFPPDVEERLAALPEPDLNDPDNPEWTPEDFARAECVDLTLPELHARLAGGEPGGPVRSVTLDLDAGVVEAFEAGGPDWRERMGAALALAAPRVPEQA